MRHVWIQSFFFIVYKASESFCRLAVSLNWYCVCCYGVCSSDHCYNSSKIETAFVVLQDQRHVTLKCEAFFFFLRHEKNIFIRHISSNLKGRLSVSDSPLFLTKITFFSQSMNIPSPSKSCRWYEYTTITLILEHHMCCFWGSLYFFFSTRQWKTTIHSAHITKAWLKEHRDWTGPDLSPIQTVWFVRILKRK